MRTSCSLGAWLTILLTVLITTVVSSGGGGRDVPVEAVVIEDEGRPPERFIAQYRVKVAKGHSDFEKGQEVRIYLTKETKVERGTGKNAKPALADGWSQGTPIRFSRYDGIQQSRPPNVYPELVVLEDLPRALAQDKEAEQQLQGSWEVVSETKNGKPLPDPRKGAFTFSFAGDRVVFKTDDKGEAYEFRFGVGPKAKLRKMDLIMGADVYRAIYQLDGNTLRLCLAEKNGERPKAFDANVGRDMILKRLKPPAPPVPGQVNEAEKLFRAMEKNIKTAKAFQVKFEITLEVDKPAQAALSKETAQQAKLRGQSASNLRQIALALHAHADAHRHLPPAAICDKDGKPVLSWRVALLPYIDQEDLFKRFKLDEPWDSPHNIKLLPLMPKLFAPVGVKIKEPFTTYYQAFAGPGAALETRRDKTSPLGAWGPRLPQDFQDGTSNTMAIAEAAEPVPWTKPAELEFDAKNNLPKLGGLFQGDFTAAFMDGTVHFISSAVDEKTRRALITRFGNELVDLAEAEKIFPEVAVDGEEKKRILKGSLLLTNDNQARLKVSRDPGERFDELVSDGKRIKTNIGLKRDWKAAKGFHDLLSTMVSRAGMRFSLVAIPHLHLSDFDADPEKLFRAYAFKAGAAEKVGGHAAKVVSYRLGRSDDPPKSGHDDEEMTVWLDSETLLPLKRVWIPLPSGLRITEVYQEFKLDPKIDANVFTIPSANAYRSPAELFANMPGDAFPKRGERGAGARRSAGEWLDSRVRDRQVDITAIIHGVSIGKVGEQRTADISLEGIQGNFAGIFPMHFELKEFSGRVTGAWYWGKPFRFGADECQTVIEPGSIRIGPIDSATAEKLRALRGTTATLRATITGCQFGIVPDGGAGPPLFCRVNVAYALINGDELPFQERVPEEKVPTGTMKK